MCEHPSYISFEDEMKILHSISVSLSLCSPIYSHCLHINMQITANNIPKDRKCLLKGPRVISTANKQDQVHHKQCNLDAGKSILFTVVSHSCLVVFCVFQNMCILNFGIHELFFCRFQGLVLGYEMYKRVVRNK